MSNQNPKTAIVLFNFGGPNTLDDVKPFLYRLFSDPAILIGIPTPFRQALAFLISTIKGPSSVEMYRRIGGGSPQLSWTIKQAKQLAGLLNIPYDDEISSDHNNLLTIAMRISHPDVAFSFEKLKTWGAERLVFLPLFPHFSTTTTGSCYEEAQRVLRKLNWCPEVHAIESWPDDSDYINYFKDLLKSKILELQQANIPKPHILFSAHSLPMKIVNRGDPYPDQIHRTVKPLAELVQDEHSLTWSLAYQSRNGKSAWLEPYTEDEIIRLAEAKVESVLVVPVSFVSDHIETLFEIDILYSDLAKKHGIRYYHRLNQFNDDLKFTKVLKSILTKQTPLSFMSGTSKSQKLAPEITTTM